MRASPVIVKSPVVVRSPFTNIVSHVRSLSVVLPLTSSVSNNVAGFNIRTSPLRVVSPDTKKLLYTFVEPYVFTD